MVEAATDNTAPASLPNADDWLANAKSDQQPSPPQSSDVTSDVWDKYKAETMDTTAGKTPDAESWLAPMQKEKYDNEMLPTMGRFILNGTAKYVAEAAKNNEMTEATGNPLGYMAKTGIVASLGALKELATKIGSFESDKETSDLYPTPVADQLKAKAQKEDRELTPDELKQIGAESGSSIAAYPKLALSPFTALSPFFDAAMDEFRRRNYSEGDLAIANTALLFTAMKAMKPADAVEGLANHTLADEQTYMGLKEPTSAETQVSAQAAQQLAEMSAQKKILPLEEPKEASSAPDIHELARAENPDAINEYHRLDTQKETLRNQIQELGDQREKDAHDNVPHSAEDIQEVQDKMDAANRKRPNKEKTERYQAQIDAMHEENATHVEQATSEDTPGMALIRKQLQEADLKQRDLSPQVSAAYRAASEKMPIEEKSVEEAKPQEETKPIEEIKPEEKPKEPAPQSASNVIAKDLSSRLVRLGRPQEEAEAISQIVAARYQARSEAFGGQRGTAEEMYHRSMPGISQGKETKARAPVLAQKEGSAELQQPTQGKYKFGINGAKAIIQLFKKADASTFMHEMAHHWLEEMMNDAKDELATDKMKSDAETVRKWSGLEDKEPITPKEKATWRKAHEKFARGFERYLMEGTAPTPKLAEVFSKFKEWLTTIYKAVESIPQQGAGITKDIRDVFDRLLSSNPEKTTIAPDREPGKMLADIHEADAKNTAPEEKDRVGDAVAKEIDDTVKLHEPEIADAIKAAETGNIPEPVAGSKEPAITKQPAGEGGATEEPATVTASGSEPAAGGAGARESDGTADTGNERGGKQVNPTKPISGAEYIKDGWFRLDKFNFSDDAKAMIRQMADANSDFMDARYGTPAYRLAKEIEAANMLVQQAGTAMEAAKNTFADSGSESDGASYLRATQQAAMAFAERSTLAADWAHGGHQLQKNIMPEGAKNAAQIIMDATGKTLFQLQMEAKLMGGQARSPAEFAKAALTERSSKLGKVNSLMLRIIYNSWLSNPITHAKYLTGIFISAMIKDVPQGLFEAGFSALRNAKAGDKFYASEIGAGLYGTLRGGRDTFSAAADAVRDGLTFMEGKQLPGAINAIGHIFGTIKLPKGMTPEAMELWRDAKNEAMEKNVFETNPLNEPGKLTINPQLAMDKASSKTPEALAEKAKLPAIYAYLENAAKAQEYTPLGAAPGTAFKDMSNAGKLGYALTVSERAISGVHTLGYAMHYGQEIARRAYRSALDAGIKVGSDEFNTQVAKFTQRPPLEDIQESHEEALKMLLMNRPKYGTFLYNIIQASHTNALAAMVMPFAQLGSRLVQYSAEQTPLAFAFKDAREDLMGKNGGLAQDRARAKISTGTALSALVIGMAAEQLITPNWSTDPGKRKEQEQNGFKPHALKVGNLYIPLTKFLGGYGPLVGEISDLVNVFHLATHEQKEKASAAFLSSIATNITDTAFTGGISNLVKASQDTEHWERYVSNMASSVIPYSSLRGQVEKFVDPYHRIAHGVLEQIERGSGVGTSYNLFPERGIWGEPLSSDTESSIGIAKNDPVTNWVTKLDFGISPIQHRINGVKLTDQQYDDYSRIAGRTSKQMLQRLMNSGIQSQPPSIQLMQVKKAIEEARNKAALYIKGQPGSNIVKDANAAKRGINHSAGK